MREHLRLKSDLDRELRNRGGIHVGHRVVRVAEALDALLIVNLVGDRAGLRQHRASGLGVGEGVLRLAFVDEAKPEAVDRDAIGIVIAALGIAAAVRVLRRLEIGRVGVDRRHVPRLPMA